MTIANEAHERVAIYGRVSTDRQDHRNQLPELLAFNPSLQFIDHASGKSSDRDQYQAMMAAAERHEFDKLVFWSLDRFGRQGILETLLAIQKLHDLGIKVHCIHDDISDELLLSVKAWIARQERLRISERTRAGMRRVMANGWKPSGRPRTINLEQRCRELRGTGMSFRQIARNLGVSVAYAHQSCLV